MKKVNEHSLSCRNYVQKKVSESKDRFVKFKDSMKNSGLDEDTQKTLRNALVAQERSSFHSDDYQEALKVVHEDTDAIRNYLKRKYGRDISSEEFEEWKRDFYSIQEENIVDASQKEVSTIFQEEPTEQIKRKYIQEHILPFIKWEKCITISVWEWHGRKSLNPENAFEKPITTEDIYAHLMRSFKKDSVSVNDLKDFIKIEEVKISSPKDAEISAQCLTNEAWNIKIHFNIKPEQIEQQESLEESEQPEVGDNEREYNEVLDEWADSHTILVPLNDKIIGIEDSEKLPITANDIKSLVYGYAKNCWKECNKDEIKQILENLDDSNFRDFIKDNYGELIDEKDFPHNIEQVKKMIISPFIDFTKDISDFVDFFMDPEEYLKNNQKLRCNVDNFEITNRIQSLKNAETWKLNLIHRKNSEIVPDNDVGIERYEAKIETLNKNIQEQGEIITILREEINKIQSKIIKSYKSVNGKSNDYFNALIHRLKQI